jgi:AcrR family transcriptional regulator
MSPPRRDERATEQLRHDLVEHARHIVERDGAAALTMRALATEAGCAVGLPYKVFADRRALVVEILLVEFERLERANEELVARAGTNTVGANLGWFSELLLGSPAVALAPEVSADEALGRAVEERVQRTGVGPGSFEQGFARYLAAEKSLARVDEHVDEDAFAFLLAGSIHNLIMSGGAWPRPSREQLRRRLDAVAETLAPRR